jgi:hypothetical protein
LADPELPSETFVKRFLRAPLYNTRYDRGFGTLYTAVYRPMAGSARFLWPNQQVEQSIESFTAGELVVMLGGPGLRR